MKTLLITDATDAKIGLRLAGIDSVIVSDSTSTVQAIKKGIADKDIGLILITERIASPIYNTVMQLKLEQKNTLLLTIPDPGSAFEDHIADYVRDSIGIKF